MKLSPICHLFSLYIVTSVVDSARILGVVPCPSFSHQVLFRPIWLELLKKGHHLTVLTTDPLGDKNLVNLTEIDLHEAYKMWNITEIGEKYKNNPVQQMIATTSMINGIIDFELSHPEVKRLINDKNEHFDLLIVEYMMPEVYAFSVRFKCPYIGIVSLDAPTYGHDLMGNPTHPVLYPDFQLPFTVPLSFKERIISVILYAVYDYFGLYILAPKSDRTIKKHFGDDYPSTEDIMNNVSMVFINTNPIFGVTRPLSRTTIEIGGGTHIREPKPLPKDIQDFLDDGGDGVVYFSLGTNVKSRHVPDNLKSALIEAFRELPYKVLWKFDENIGELPGNVRMVKWCSQQDVLRHPNVKLFITQGGLQSTEEAIMNHVPLVGIPFFMDQLGNVKRMVQKRIGVYVDKNTANKEAILKAINGVITNPEYKKNVFKLAEQTRDQPMTGLEKAVWWIEYILRHNGTEDLKTPRIPKYQYYLLDVILFFLVIVSVILYISIKLIRLILRKLFQRKLKNE